MKYSFKRRPTVKKKELFIFILSVVYHSCLFEENISTRWLARGILLFCKVRKDRTSNEYLEVETLAHYIRREPVDYLEFQKEIRQILEDKFYK